MRRRGSYGSGPRRTAARAGFFRGASGAAALVLSLALSSSCSVEITADRYALVYGAQDYDNLPPATTNDLSATAYDAQDMAAALSAAGWTVQQVRQPTVDKAQIQADIAALVGVVDSDSSVLVYFSGHGTDYLGTTYILPTDAISDSGAAQIANFIAPLDVLSWLNTLPCRNRVVILDTCYSGGFVAADDTGTVDAASQNYGVYDDGTGASTLFEALGSYSDLLAAAFDSYDPYTPMVVTAAGAKELSYESSDNGVFTKYFLESASKGDLDGNGGVTLQEAYRYARGKVDAYWNSTYYAYYESSTGTYADFLPRISGNARDIVIF